MQPCPSLTVASGSALKAGRRGLIVVTVRRSGDTLAGARVVLRGAGVSKTARTGANGVARVAVKPTRAGLITIRLAGQPARCGASRRVGVTRLAAPIVTG